MDTNDCKPLVNSNLDALITQNASLPTCKQITKVVIDKLEKLKSLLIQHNSVCWEIGDLCIDLMTNHYLTLANLGKMSDYSKARLSDFHLTSRLFAPNQRQEGSFQDALMARQIYQKLPTLGLTPTDIRSIIIRMQNKRPHQIRAHFIQLLLKQEQNKALVGSSKQNSDNLTNSCHHADWRSVVPLLPNGSVKLFVAEANYEWGCSRINKSEKQGAVQVG